MVKNPELESVGKEVIKTILRGAALPEELVENTRIEVDETYRVRMMIGRGLVYVYDFTKPNEEDISTKDLYNRAVKNTEMMHELDPKHFEELIGTGIVKNRFGFYVTKI